MVTADDVGKQVWAIQAAIFEPRPVGELVWTHKTNTSVKRPDDTVTGVYGAAELFPSEEDTIHEMMNVLTDQKHEIDVKMADLFGRLVKLARHKHLKDTP